MESKKSLFDVFKDIPDPRRQGGNLLYPLEELMFLTISGVLCGLEDWVHISEFGKDQILWLRKYFPYENGVPSHDCLGDVFSNLDTDLFGKAFIKWTSSLSEHSEGEVISIDGKRVRGSYDNHKGKSAIHIVSAFASVNGLVMGQVKCNDKSNEITAIPDLLDLISVQGCLVTIDAMGCQKKIAQKIEANGADYVLSLKANQEELFEEVKKAFEFIPVGQTDEQVNTGHGRVEKRYCEIITDLRFIDESTKWKGIKSIVRIHAQRHHKTNGKQEEEYRYYISSIVDARKINQAVRLHWSIENQLHWVLDVQFAEDRSRKRNGSMPQNFGLITKMALNLIKQNPMKGSIKVKRMKAAWNKQFRQQLLKI